MPRKAKMPTMKPMRMVKHVPRTAPVRMPKGMKPKGMR
jgi:hypothetical protein